MKRQPFPFLLRWGLITTSLAALLFLAAGTTHLPSIRSYLAIFSSLLLTTMLTVDPHLAKERTRPEATAIDDGLRVAAGLLFLLTLTLAVFFVGRLRFDFDMPNPVSEAALVAVALSVSLQTWTMVVNPFFSPVVRIQTERGHRVITDGPYRFMRHPAISPC